MILASAIVTGGSFTALLASVLFYVMGREARSDAQLNLQAAARLKEKSEAELRRSKLRMEQLRRLVEIVFPKGVDDFQVISEPVDDLKWPEWVEATRNEHCIEGSYPGPVFRKIHYAYLDFESEVKVPSQGPPMLIASAGKYRIQADLAELVGCDKQISKRLATMIAHQTIRQLLDLAWDRAHDK